MADMTLKSRLSTLTPSQAYDQLLGGPGAGQRVVTLKLSDLEPYPNQPFRPYSQQKLLELAEDIKANGVMSPILVRPREADAGHPYKWYEILSGHNRASASKLALLDDIPAIVMDVDDDRATEILVNANLNQRDRLLPSEKAFAYKLRMDAQKRRSGERNDLRNNLGSAVYAGSGSLVPIGNKVDTATEIARLTEDSRTDIYRYIRLTELIPELLEQVDAGDLPLRSGVAVSYLSKEEQTILSGYLARNRKQLPLETAEQIKRYSGEIAPVDIPSLERLFAGKKPRGNQKRPLSFKKPAMKKIAACLPAWCAENEQEAAEYVLAALAYYREHGETGAPKAPADL